MFELSEKNSRPKTYPLPYQLKYNGARLAHGGIHIDHYSFATFHIILASFFWDHSSGVVVSACFEQSSICSKSLFALPGRRKTALVCRACVLAVGEKLSRLSPPSLSRFHLLALCVSLVLNCSTDLPEHSDWISPSSEALAKEFLSQLIRAS
jgi:hypothetical protein